MTGNRTEYHKQYREEHKERLRESRAAWYKKNRAKHITACSAYNKALPREVVRHWNLKSRFGIGLAEFKAIADSQNNVCAICERAEKLCVDHDHATGKIRGLLCGDCNLVLDRLHADRARFEEYKANGDTGFVAPRKKK